jgi:hypothetical protein
MMLRGGDRRSKSHSERLKLDDLGISRNQSTRWQIEARLPEEKFRDHIRQTCESGKELTSSRLMRLARQWVEPRVVDATPHEHKGHSSNGEEHRLRLGIARTNSPQAGSKFNVGQTPADPAAEAIAELTNHLQLLDGILRPIYSGQSPTLVAAERRVLRYLLLESQKLIARLNNFQRNTSQCICHHDSLR